MPARRHGRQPTFSRPTAVVFAVVVVGVVAVGVLAEVGLALRLAIGGALAVSVMVWAVYREALRDAHQELAHQRALHSRTSSELSALRLERERTVRGMQLHIDRLAAELEVAARQTATTGSEESPELWPDLADAPTVVDLANRRDTQSAPSTGTARHASRRNVADTA